MYCLAKCDGFSIMYLLQILKRNYLPKIYLLFFLVKTLSPNSNVSVFLFWEINSNPNPNANCNLTSQVTLVVRNPPANAGYVRYMGLSHWLGRSLGEGNGNPHQYSCLENPIDTGAWRIIVHGVAKSWKRLSVHSTQTHATIIMSWCWLEFRS